jgi:phage terminase small subunit
MNNSTQTQPIEGEIVVKNNSPRISHKPISKMPLKQRKFVKYYKETGNGTKSAKLAGYSPLSAAQQASALLKNPNVLAILNDSVEEAEGVIQELMRSENEGIRLKAATETLDRTIGKPIQRSESVNVTISVESMLDDMTE